MAANQTNTTTAGATGTAGATRRHLPRTASGLALYELLSGLSLAGGFVMRALRR